VLHAAVIFPRAMGRNITTCGKPCKPPQRETKYLYEQKERQEVTAPTTTFFFLISRDMGMFAFCCDWSSMDLPRDQLSTASLGCCGCNDPLNGSQFRPVAGGSTTFVKICRQFVMKFRGRSKDIQTVTLRSILRGKTRSDAVVSFCFLFSSVNLIGFQITHTDTGFACENVISCSHSASQVIPVKIKALQAVTRLPIEREYATAKSYLP
jgi:hypothetical protein